MKTVIRRASNPQHPFRETIHRMMIYLGSFSLLVLLTGCDANEPSTPISFKALQNQSGTDAGKLQFLKAADGIDLACYGKLPQGKPVAAVIFLHGGGAYSEAGYQPLAAGLSGKYETAVYLTDLRGHGRSGGPRGDAPSIELVWDDLKLLVEDVRKKHPGVPLYLGGHSSGAGLILNYISWNRKADVDGYFLSRRNSATSPTRPARIRRRPLPKPVRGCLSCPP